MTMSVPYFDPLDITMRKTQEFGDSLPGGLRQLGLSVTKSTRQDWLCLLVQGKM